MTALNRAAVTRTVCPRCAAGDEPRAVEVFGKQFCYHRTVVEERHGVVTVRRVGWVACGAARPEVVV